MQAASSRVLSVDVLRGLTIAFMILVNDPGDWDHVYAQLDHAPGTALPAPTSSFPTSFFSSAWQRFSRCSSRMARGELPQNPRAAHRPQRGADLSLLKMFITAVPYFHYTHFRLYGVLTRIALCYLAVGLICLVTLRMRALARHRGRHPDRLLGADAFRPRTRHGWRLRDHPHETHSPSSIPAAISPRGSTAPSAPLPLRTIHTGTLYDHGRATPRACSARCQPLPRH